MIKKDAIVTKILTLIQTGILSPGDKLPSLRQIAADNRVSLYTAIGAYEELVAMGVIENVPKVGSFVLDCGGNVEKLLKMRNSALPIRQELEAPENVRIYERYSENLQIARETESTQLSREWIGEDFYGDTQYDVLRDIVRKVPASRKWQFFQEEKNRLLASIAQLMLPKQCYFLRDNMQLFSNPMEALLMACIICCATAAESGMAIAIESPGTRLFRMCAQILNVDYVEIPSDRISGLRVDALEKEILAGRRFLGLLCQSYRADPTGASMPDGEKARLVELCSRENVPIIEYDALGSLSIADDPPPPIKSLNHESVIYIADLCCVVGYDLPAVCMESGKYARRIEAMRTFFGAFAATNESIAVVANLVGRELPARVKSLNASVRACTNLFVRELERTAPPGLRIYGGESGPYLWIELPEGTVTKDFSTLASKNRVFVAPGPMFSSMEDSRRCFRVNCCAHRAAKSVTADARALGAMITEYLNSLD